MLSGTICENAETVPETNRTTKASKNEKNGVNFIYEGITLNITEAKIRPIKLLKFTLKMQIGEHCKVIVFPN